VFLSLLVKDPVVPREQVPKTAQKRSISEKAAYSRTAQKRLSEVEVRLTGVKAKVRSAVASGHIAMTLQLEDALLAVDANLASVKAALDCVRKSGDTTWMECTRDMDTAWENLSQSIKRLVAGYSDGLR